MPKLDLSATQLVATALAAVTATIAASYLGVSGTVIGAALAAVVSAVGNAVYAHSLHKTRVRVREVVPARRGTVREPGHVFPPQGRSEPAAAAARQETVIHGERRPWRGVLIGATALFAGMLTIVTGVEVVAGRPISDLVRGDSGTGTSLFGDSNPSPTSTRPGTTSTVTVTPSVVVTTPTVTQTAPAVTQTATPTVTETPSSSGGPSGSDSPSVEPTPSPSQIG